MQFPAVALRNFRQALSKNADGIKTAALSR
jgi:hypothetical protein